MPVSLDDTFTFRGGTGVVGSDLDAYRALYSHADISQEGPTFSADVRAWRLNGFLLFDRKLSGLLQERCRVRTEADALEHYTFQLNRAGEVEFDRGDGFRPLNKGEGLLLDLRQPMRARYKRVHLTTAALARDLVKVATGRDDLHGLVFKAEATAALRTKLAAQGDEHAHTPVLLDSPGITTAVSEILIQAVPTAPGAARRRRAMVTRYTVDSYIAANLGRRDLGPAEIAAACGVSRAGLYRMASPSGGVVSLIRRRRLAELERQLARGAPGPVLHQLAEALGFADENLMSRQFRRSAGSSPGRYRTRVHDDAAHAAAHSRWAAWMAELH